MYGSQAAPRDFNLNGKEDSDLNHYQQQQQQMGGTGLLRFRSAPSSLLGEMCEDFLPHRSSTTESETVFTGFAPPELRDQVGGSGGGGGAGQRSPRFVPDMERGASATAAHRQNGELSPTAASQMMYHAQQHLPSHGSTAVAAAVAVEGSYRVASSAATDGEDQKSTVKSSNLVRHSSSPAGLFSHLSVENGYAVMGGMGGGGFRVGTCSAGEAATVDGRLRGQLSFSSRQTSSSGLMSQISEIGGEGMGGGSSPEEGSLENGRCFMPGFPVASWDDPSLLSENFSGMKRARDPSEAQIGDVRCHAPTLTHHYSLPKNSSEMAAILQFQEAVPCKIRAKRGCATHPRSIAERVRRTRISERMRKLQELVPNMDKQTNTADMLDLAVDYIKDLERQVKSLAESRANCTCSNKQKP